MDVDTEKLCRLCLQTGDDVVNIWNTFQNSTIASILVKHFWFQVHKNDGLTEWLCQICWIQTTTFHEFYKKVEQLQKCFWDSIEKDISDKAAIIDIDCKDAVLELDLNIVKCEETEMRTEAIDSQISRHDSFDYDYNEDNISGESEAEKTDDEDQCTNSEQKNVDNQVRTPNVKRKVWFSPSERMELEGQIRELFNMKCEICSDVKFETLLNARQHYRKVHDMKGYIKCCGKKFTRRIDIVKHIRYHINPDAYRCDQCNKSFSTKYSLENHIDNHVPLDSRAFKCSLCPSSFAKAYTLKHHVQFKHTSKTGEKFPCDKCGKNFRSSLLLACHIRQVHEFAFEHMCEVCARTFKNKQALQYHISQEHSATPPPKVQCNICGVWLKSLHKHRQLHQDVKPLNCPICNKEVRNKSFLNRHIAYVHGEKRHQCTICDKAFTNAKSLKEHIAIHTGEYLYDCTYCEKKFKSNANMYNHRKKAHLAEWTRDFPQRSKLKKVSANEEIEAELKK